MEVLWAAPDALTVADVHKELMRDRSLAYTTVMTVLDRLAKKDLATRELVGRAWNYRAADPQHVVVAREMGALLEDVPDAVRVRALAEFAKGLRAADREALAG